MAHAASADTATNATNADKLDGLDANSLVRVAGARSANLPDVDGDALKAQITAPRSGLLHIVGSVELFNGSSGDIVNCWLEVDGPTAAGSNRITDLDGELTTSTVSGHSHTVSDVNTREDCATNAVIAVGAGARTVDLHLSSVETGTVLLGGALNVLFVPFDGAGELSRRERGKKTKASSDWAPRGRACGSPRARY